MIYHNRRSKYFPMIITAAVLLVLELFYFRNIIGNDLMLGDSGDARFNNLVVEHLYRFFCGQESWADLPIFYPMGQTLAYSDILLGFAFPYSVLRVFGINMLLANKIMLIFIHAAGTFSAFLFLRKKLKLSSLASLTGTVIFSYTHMLNSCMHTQLFAICFLPALAFFVYSYFENINGLKRKRIVSGLAAITTLELIFYTSFYIGYFTIVFSIIFSVVYCLISGIRHKNAVKSAFNYVKAHCPEFIAYTATAVVLIIPLLMLYLPASGTFGARGWINDAAFRLPNLIDFINVSSGNLVFGRLFSGLAYPHQDVEWKTGFPIGILIIFFTAAFYFVKDSLPSKWMKPFRRGPLCIDSRNGVKQPCFAQVLCVLSLSVVSTFILILKVGDSVSLWWFVYKLLPGASALRAVIRFNQFLAFFLCIVVSVFFDVVRQKVRLRPSVEKPVFFIVFLLFFAQVVWIGGAAAQWKASDAQAFLDSVPAPPADCEIMYIRQAPPDTARTDYYNFQLDAWMIAAKYNLKTLNGYSGQFPPGWRLYEVTCENYETNASQWVELHSLENVYSYNQASAQWEAHKTIAEHKIINYITKNTPSKNSVFSENAIHIRNGGLVYGPYIFLSAKKYVIVINGRNLSAAAFDSVFASGTKIIETEELEHTDTRIAFSVDLNLAVPDAEFRIFNNSDQNVTVTSLIVQEGH